MVDNHQHVIDSLRETKQLLGAKDVEIVMADGTVATVGNGDGQSEIRDAVDQIIDAADQATSRLGEFMHYAKMRDPNPVALSVETVVSKRIQSASR